MKKIIVVIRNLETKEPIGAVTSVDEVNPIEFGVNIMLTWPLFCSVSQNFNLQDYIEFHNSHFPVKIKEHDLHIMRGEMCLN